MFILKFFASIFLLFFCIGLLFLVVSFIIARNFVSELSDSLKSKMDENNPPFSSDLEDESNIPNAIECPVCGTFYVQMPANKRCSCGAKLSK